MGPNLQMMFDVMKDLYFSTSLKAVNYTVEWDKNGDISDSSFFKISPHHRIYICTEAMLRPRIQLVSVLLHILIHVHIKTSSKGSIRIDKHDENFRIMMLFLNENLNTQINVSYTVLFKHK